MIDPSAATRAFTLLADRGWIRRRRGENDRRTSVIELTARGRHMLERGRSDSSSHREGDRLRDLPPATSPISSAFGQSSSR